MLKLSKHHRRDYQGEKLVVERTYEDGVWQDTVEWIDNAVDNIQISNTAIVLGNGPSRLQLGELFPHFKKPKGLLGSRSPQIYGCNAVYRDFEVDFLIASGSPAIVKEIAESKYVKNNVVYTNAIHLLEYPNQFYLIPHDPYVDAGTTAIYLAAFDHHKRIFMLGFDNQDTPGHNYNIYAGTQGYDTVKTNVMDHKWIANKKQVFDIYHDVEFFFVTREATERLPEAWMHCPNVTRISRNEFIDHADL